MMGVLGVSGWSSRALCTFLSSVHVLMQHGSSTVQYRHGNASY